MSQAIESQEVTFHEFTLDYKDAKGSVEDCKKCGSIVERGTYKPSNNPCATFVVPKPKIMEEAPEPKADLEELRSQWKKFAESMESARKALVQVKRIQEILKVNPIVNVEELLRQEATRTRTIPKQFSKKEEN